MANWSKIIKKAYGVALALFDLIFITYLVFILSLQFYYVQNVLAKESTKFLSKKLQTEVHVDRVYIDLFSRLHLMGLYIEDQSGDTLLYTYDLDLSYAFEPLLENRIQVNGLCLNDSRLRFLKARGSDSLNAQFIFNLFKSSGDTSEFVIDLALRNLEINNMHFSLNDENTEKKIGFDPSHLDLKNIDLDLFDARFDGRDFKSAELFCSVNSSDEFILKNLEAEVNGGPGGIVLKKMEIRTNRTKLSGDLTFKTRSWSDYSSFVDSVHMDLNLDKSAVSLSDISYFAPALRGVIIRPRISGNISGRVSDLSAENLRLSIENHSSLILGFRIKGLPDIDKTFFDLKIDHLRTSKKGLETIALPSGGGSRHIELPEQLSALGQIHFEGELVGMIDDLKAKGDLQTDIGELIADVELKNRDILQYKGFVKTKDLDIGKLTASDLLGKVTMQAKIDGRGSKSENIELSVNGLINRIYLNHYDYTNIKIAGDYAQENFRGNINIDDRNVHLNFVGNIDLGKDEKVFNFMAEIDSLRPYYVLHSKNFDSTASISTTINIDIQAKDIDSLVGHLDLMNTTYSDAEGEVVMNELVFESSRDKGEKDITLRSDIADFRVKGKFDMLDNFSTVKFLAKQYFPKLVPDSMEMDKDFEFDLKIKDYSLVEAMLTPGLSIGENSWVKGYYNTLKGDLKIDGMVYDFHSGALVMDTINMAVLTKENILEMNNEIIMVAKGRKNRRIVMHMEASNNHLEAKMRSRGGGLAADLNFNAHVHKVDSIALQVVDSRFLLGDSIWYFDNDNKIVYDGGAVQIERFKAFKNQEYIVLDGRMSQDPADELEVEMVDFNLIVLNKFLKNSNVDLRGIVNGKASVRDFYGDRLFQSKLKFNELGFNGHIIGSGGIESAWNPNSEKLMVNGELHRGDTNTLKINGFYDAANPPTSLNFDIKLAFIPLSEFEPFTTGILSDFKGICSASLKLRGSSSAPELTGKMGLARAGMKVDYLNTAYMLKNSESDFLAIPIQFEKDFIRIPNFTLVDEYGNTAKAGITFLHNGFKKMDLGIYLETDRFLAMNTNSGQNETFYGKAFIAGTMDIGIGKDLTKLNMNITALDGTRFSLPLKLGAEVTENQFVVFERPVNVTDEEEEVTKEIYNVDLRMKVRATPGAEMRLVFDEAVGDVLRARGTGDLDINYKPEKGLDMTGEFIIESGDYLFTLETVVNKKFYIEQGSTIKWNGDPLKGEMNITTSYRLRTKLKNILPPIYEDVNYERMTPVELQLAMSDYVESPTFDFSVNLPNTNANGKSQLENILSSEDCMNQQVLSLLVLNTFTPCEYIGEQPQTSVGRATAYETMSNQLSNWLSKISDDVDVGFTYRPEIQDENEVTPEQVEVALSTQLFNDRLIIDGNVGYGDQSVTNTQQTSDVVGEFTIEYKIRPDGKLRIKAFNHVNDRSYIENDNLYVQGVGFSWRTDWGGAAAKKPDDGKKEEE